MNSFRQRKKAHTAKRYGRPETRGLAARRCPHVRFPCLLCPCACPPKKQAPSHYPPHRCATEAQVFQAGFSALGVGSLDQVAHVEQDDG
eukprot:g67963.t1